jgi:hypothetical protein
MRRVGEQFGLERCRCCDRAGPCASARARSEGGRQDISGHCSRDLLVPLDTSELGRAVDRDQQVVPILFAGVMFITLEDEAEVARRLAAAIPGGACRPSQDWELAGWTQRTSEAKAVQLASFCI